MTPEEVFVRKASGLVREVGLTSAFLFNLTGAANLTFWTTAAPYLILFANTGNQALALIIGGIAAMLVDGVYAHFIATMPRSGGEYVFLARTMKPQLGFMVNFTMASIFLFWWVYGQLLMVDITKVFLHGLMPAESYAWMYQPEGAFLLSVAFMIVLAFVAVGEIKWYMRIQNVVWIAAFVAAGIVAAGFIAATPNFPTIFNTWAQQYAPNEPDMYHKIIADAAASGFRMNPPEGPMLEQTLTFAAMVLTWIAPYTLVSGYIAGEVKQANSLSRQLIMMAGAGFALLAMWVLLGSNWINMAGMKFIASVAALPNTGLPISIFSWSWTQIVLPVWADKFYLIMVFLTCALCMINFLIVCSRCMLAWSFDRLLPTRLSHVNERFKAPLNAIAVLFIVGVIMLYGAVYASFWTYIAAASFWTIINISIVCIAGIIFPYVRKDTFERTSMKGRTAGIPRITIVSVLALIFTIWTSLAYFINPSFMSYFGLTPVAIATSAFIYAMALVIYYVARAYWRSKGIDIGLAFKTIPPE
jgi:APA family basic amino acid/polyamine antiporter